MNVCTKIYSRTNLQDSNHVYFLRRMMLIDVFLRLSLSLTVPSKSDSNRQIRQTLQDK